MMFPSFTKLALPVALLSPFLPFIYGLPYTPRYDTSSNTALRILPLGDSITWGWQPEHRQDGTDGYRAELLKGLLDAGYKVDFVGSQHSGNMTDNDNEGHSGFTISQIHEAMSPGVEMRPNVVLLHAGTNDLSRPETTEPWSEAPARLGSVIDDVLKTNPDAVVLVAKIIPFNDATTQDNIDVYNAKVPDVAKARADKGFKVTVVDQSIIGIDELIDGVHPTDAGYAHMGKIWFASVKAVAEEGIITPPV